MSRRGRPSKFKNDMIKDSETLAGLGFTERDFCVYWGIKRAAFYKWKAKNKGELRDAIERGKNSANINIVKKIYEKAIAGSPSLLMFWATNQMPETWKNKHQVDGIPETPRTDDPFKDIPVPTLRRMLANYRLKGGDNGSSSIN